MADLRPTDPAATKQRLLHERAQRHADDLREQAHAAQRIADGYRIAHYHRMKELCWCVACDKSTDDCKCVWLATVA